MPPSRPSNLSKLPDKASAAQSLLPKERLSAFPSHELPEGTSALLIFENGQIIPGYGFGREGFAVGELCFNTAMTGYQEILTDPSYAHQIINFTFPHIGNVGTNSDDLEQNSVKARGLIVREMPTPASSFRAESDLAEWAKAMGLIGLYGVDTRALTHLIRVQEAPKVVIAYQKNGQFDFAALQKALADWPGLQGLDLAKEVSCTRPILWDKPCWSWPRGSWQKNKPEKHEKALPDPVSSPHVVALDYGAKDTILRFLVSAGLRVTLMPADSSYAAIMAQKPDGIFLSNGPGDPAATGLYALPVLKALIETGLPIFGICLGHQLLGLAFGGKSYKMLQGHRGANHPVLDCRRQKVTITSMNHGFAIDAASLGPDIEISHISLFDGSLCGLRHKSLPIFSVQQHPEASPGPEDSAYLFDDFAAIVKAHKGSARDKTADIRDNAVFPSPLKNRPV